VVVTCNAEVKLIIKPEDGEKTQLENITLYNRRLSNLLKVYGRVAVKIPFEYKEALPLAIEAFRLNMEGNSTMEIGSDPTIDYDNFFGYSVSQVIDSSHIVTLSRVIGENPVVFIIQDDKIRSFIKRCGCLNLSSIPLPEDQYQDDVLGKFKNLDNAIWLLKSSRDLSGDDLCILLKDHSHINAEFSNDEADDGSEFSQHISTRDYHIIEGTNPHEYKNCECQTVEQECFCKKITRVLKSKSTMKYYIGAGAVLCSIALHYYCPMVTSAINKMANGVACVLKSGAISTYNGFKSVYNFMGNFFCSPFKNKTHDGFICNEKGNCCKFYKACQ
jgi:hypothetical protein